MPRKVYILALCGAADRPLASLGGRTPLAAARTPNLDELARGGAMGTVDVIGADIPPESDSGALALLGYDPLRHYTGRGPLEGLGMGFLQRDAHGRSVCFRINFATYLPDDGVFDRRTGRDLTDAELQELVEDVRTKVELSGEDGVELRITGFGRHRGVLAFVADDGRLGGNVGNTDPEYEKRGAFGLPRRSYDKAPARCAPLDDREQSKTTAALVNDFVAESTAVLSRSRVNRARTLAGKLPANVILLRDGGSQPPELTPFRDRFGLSLGIFGQIPAEKGLAELLGGSWHDSRRAGGVPEDHYYEDLARRLADDDQDVVYVHLKGADEPAHDGDVAGKVEALERLDACFMGVLAGRLRDEDVMVVTGDHATPCELRIHSSDPVPALVRAGGLEGDGTTEFSEASAQRGGLGRLRGCQVMSLIQGL